MALNLTRMICGRIILHPQMNYLRSPSYLAATKSISIKVVQPEETSALTYEERNTILKRELSPHLTIFKFQLPSVLSISHRFTGMILASYVTTLGVGALILPHDFSHYVTMIEGLQLSGGCLITLKFLLAYPFAYHTCNGIRHLIWDLGKFLKIGEVYTTGYIMLGSSALLTGILALL